MSTKLLIHTALSMGLATMLVFQIRAGRRRMVYGALLLSVLASMLSPWAYKWFGAPFPRVTLTWFQVSTLGCLLAVFTPGVGRRAEAIDSDRFDLPATAPAPLDAETARQLYH